MTIDRPEEPVGINTTSPTFPSYAAAPLPLPPFLLSSLLFSSRSASYFSYPPLLPHLISCPFTSSSSAYFSPLSHSFSTQFFQFLVPFLLLFSQTYYLLIFFILLTPSFTTTLLLFTNYLVLSTNLLLLYSIPPLPYPPPP